MPLTFAEWGGQGGSYAVIDVSDPAGWAYVRTCYTDRTNPALDRVIEIAEEHGVRSVVVEYRYIDVDWRSEHNHFYGSTFERFPSICHRLHFFTANLSDAALLEELETSAVAESYRGYSIMRPLPQAPVGRTMLEPPPELASATKATADECVHLFGVELHVTGMPFISQDALYLRCAHAAIWMVLRHAHLRHGQPRRVPSDIREAAMGGDVVNRQLPSEGLSSGQMLAALDTLGLPTGRIFPDADTGPGVVPRPGEHTLYGVVCRYVSSNLPPIATSNVHAWVVVAWARTKSAGHGALTLWRHDDAFGPYIRVDNPWLEPIEAHKPWVQILTPLLPGMNLDAERAEMNGARYLRTIAKLVSGDPDGASTPLGATYLAGQMTWRTFAVSSNEFKDRATRRGLPEELTRAIRLAQLPKQVWVVEAVDKEARDRNEPDVVASAVFDSTFAGALRNTAEPLLMHGAGGALTYNLDTRRKESIELSSADRVISAQLR